MTGHELGEEISTPDEIGAYLKALAAAADELLARAPELPQALELRGRAALALGEPARALAVFTQLIEKLPNRAAGYALRASAYEANSNAPSAVREYSSSPRLSNRTMVDFDEPTGQCRRMTRFSVP